MEIFRVSHNVWGQEVLEGLSFELFWVFLGGALAVVIAHMIYMWLRPGRPDSK